MKGSPDCIPCLLRRTLVSAREIADDPWLHRKVLNDVMAHLQKADIDLTPAELVYELFKRAGKALGNQDALENRKEEHRLEAKALEKRLRKRVDEAAEPLHEAIVLAAAANVVDGAVLGPITLAEGLRQLDTRAPAIDDSRRLIEGLDKVGSILYVCDNAGEILLDRLLIERLVAMGKSVTSVVRRRALVNDATLEDASWAGLAELGPVIDVEAAAAGMPLALVSAEVRTCFDEADMVIAKGSAAYQTLEGEAKKKYFLLRAKCEVVARHLGVVKGDVVILGD